MGNCRLKMYNVNDNTIYVIEFESHRMAVKYINKLAYLPPMKAQVYILNYNNPINNDYNDIISDTYDNYCRLHPYVALLRDYAMRYGKYRKSMCIIDDDNEKRWIEL